MRTGRPAALDEVTGIEPDEFEGVAMSGAHDREMAAVNRRDTRHVVAFGDRDQSADAVLARNWPEIGPN